MKALSITGGGVRGMAVLRKAWMLVTSKGLVALLLLNLALYLARSLGFNTAELGPALLKLIAALG